MQEPRMMAAYRPLLFVPGSPHDRFGNALAAGADGVIIDLEDAVLPADKAQACTETLAWLGAYRGAGAGVCVGVRINSPRRYLRARHCMAKAKCWTSARQNRAPGRAS
jgi:citrate lyase beta subunit